MDTSTVIAIVALLVAALSAWATFFGPQRAAELAEGLRAGSAKAERRDLAKLNVLAMLMQERAAPYTFDAVKAFNLIDIAFADCEPVREAWRVYFGMLDPARYSAVDARREKLNQLLIEMAKDVGLDSIKLSDMERVYSPTYVMRRLAIDDMQTTLQEDTLKKALAENAANTTPSSV